MESFKLNEIEQRVSDDLNWALTAAEVQQHAGKLVAVYNKRVVGVGTDRMVLVHEAAQREQCHWGDIAVVVVPSREVWETHQAEFRLLLPPKDGLILLP